MKTKTKPSKFESLKDRARKKFEALPERMQLMICLVPNGKTKWINLEAVAAYLDTKTKVFNGVAGNRLRKKYLRENDFINN